LKETAPSQATENDAWLWCFYDTLNNQYENIAELGKQESLFRFEDYSVMLQEGFCPSESCDLKGTSNFNFLLSNHLFMFIL